MKQIAIAVAVAAFATATQAAPKDNTWYTGIKLGLSHFQNTAFHPYGDDVDDSKNKRDQFSTGAYIGYQHNQYLGFELGYDWFSQIKYVGKPNVGSVKSMGVQVTARFIYPITESLDVYTRLGSMMWNTDVQATVENQEPFKGHKASASPMYGLGLEYTITPKLATRLDYQWVRHMGDKGVLSVRPDNGTLSVGVTYRFNQQPASVIVPATAPIESKRFTLRSDVLFEFNQHMLKPEGKVELDKLYSELTDLDPSQGRVIIFGYTDRIGSVSYNKSLSQKRAHEVMSYLISKGIPENVISSQGRGTENPVTGTTCNDIKSRHTLIECLAPDRRVEIEIQGTTDITSQPSMLNN
ncbi:MAG: porin OmpA [Candidatus Arsenophonus melophagi]|nr:porin OmpA [Candidatus Arsenophonus melophagi]